MFISEWVLRAMVDEMVLYFAFFLTSLQIARKTFSRRKPHANYYINISELQWTRQASTFE